MLRAFPYMHAHEVDVAIIARWEGERMAEVSWDSALRAQQIALA
jgi:hypothetical protein